jgi:hypothetical protein
MAKKEPLHQMPIDELINSIIGDMKTISDKRHLKASIVFKIRMAGTYQPRTASVNAQKRADELGIGDLRRFDWGDQPSRMKDPGRKIFHFEHVNPLNNIVESILKSKCETAIRSHIMKIKIAWILKEEDRLLTKGIGGSWRSKRPDDAYERLNIQLVD